MQTVLSYSEISTFVHSAINIYFKKWYLASSPVSLETFSYRRYRRWFFTKW